MRHAPAIGGTIVTAGGCPYARPAAHTHTMPTRTGVNARDVIWAQYTAAIVAPTFVRVILLETAIIVALIVLGRLFA